MDTKIAALQKACDELVYRMEQLDAWMPDSASKHAKRLMTVVTRHSNEVTSCAKELINYVPKEEGCRCGELKEILELIPKKLSLGEFLELWDLIANHFQKSDHAPFPQTGSGLKG